jgi:hypothetical protein
MRGVPPPELIVLSPSPYTEPFWDAAAQHRFVVPRCVACATFRFPPSPFCWRCRAQGVDWVDHDGAGTVYSFTVIRHAVIPEMAGALPLVAAVVALAGTEGCRAIGNVVGCEPDDVTIGAAVSLDWYDVRDGTSVPVFRLQGR